MDYINKEAFKRKLIDEKSFFPALVARALEEMPAADVVEVKHGEWENMGDNFANCSHCGTIFEALPTMFAFKSNNIICRHCGAKMDGGKKE